VAKLTKTEALRIINKGKRARQALLKCEIGEDNNVINLVSTFEVKMWQNNRKMWLELFDTKRKLG
jgi:hypothetical protein